MEVIFSIEVDLRFFWICLALLRRSNLLGESIFDPGIFSSMDLLATFRELSGRSVRLSFWLRLRKELFPRQRGRTMEAVRSRKSSMDLAPLAIKVNAGPAYGTNFKYLWNFSANFL
jgi:hypothetical protein